MTPLLDRADIKVIEIFLEEFDAVWSRACGKVLLHGELNEEHILWDEERLEVNTIDLSACAFSDPAHDFAELWIYGPQFVERVLELYELDDHAGLIQKSKLLFMGKAISLMLGPVEGPQATFRSGLTLFRQRFR